MAQPQKHPLRPFNDQEERELQRIVKARSERVDVVRRARTPLVVSASAYYDDWNDFLSPNYPKITFL